MKYFSGIWCLGDQDESRSFQGSAMDISYCCFVDTDSSGYNPSDDDKYDNKKM